MLVPRTLTNSNRLWSKVITCILLPTGSAGLSTGNAGFRRLFPIIRGTYGVGPTRRGSRVAHRNAAGGADSLLLGAELVFKITRLELQRLNQQEQPSLISYSPTTAAFWSFAACGHKQGYGWVDGIF